MLTPKFTKRTKSTSNKIIRYQKTRLSSLKPIRTLKIAKEELYSKSFGGKLYYIGLS
jgi:hypothetical protein